MTTSKWMVLSVILAACTPLWSSGFGLYEQGVDGHGNNGAHVAFPDGPSALFHNPAGMAHMRGSEFAISARGLFSRSFYGNAGQSGWETETQTDVVPNLFSTFMFDKFVMGVGVSALYDYEADWDETDFPGRFLGTESEFTGYEAMLGFAYRISPRWSIGFSARFAQMDMTQARILPRSLEAEDASLFYEVEERFEADGDGTGFSAGLQYFHPRRWGLGVAYWSKIEIDDMEGDRTFTQFNRLNDQRAADLFARDFGPAPLTTGVNLPERLAVGFWTRVTVRTRLEVDLEGARWSEVEQTAYQTAAVDGSPETIVFPRNWDDSFSARIAGQFQQRRALRWRAGIGFVANTVPDETLSPFFADNDRFIYSFGVSYTYKRRYVLEAAWSYTQNRDRESRDQEFLLDPNTPGFLAPNGAEGLYETQRSHLSIGFRYKFGSIRKLEGD